MKDLGSFFAHELGAQSRFDEKKPEKQQGTKNEKKEGCPLFIFSIFFLKKKKAYISGEYEIRDLSKLTEKFIEQILLCKKCGLPEQSFTAEKKNIMGRCRACGNADELNISNDKFKRFMFNHIPCVNNKYDFGDIRGSKINNQNLKKIDPKKKQEQEEKKQEFSDEEEGIVWFSDPSKEAAKKRREIYFSKPSIEKSPTKQTESNEFNVNLLKEYFIKEQLPVLDLNKETQLSDIDLDKYVQILIKARKTIFAQICEEDYISVICEYFFTPEEIYATFLHEKKQIPSTLLARVLLHSINTQQSELGLLISMEKMAFKNNKLLYENFTFVVWKLYHMDVLQEDQILVWYQVLLKNNQLREKLTSMIDWLKTSEEEK